MDVHDMVEGQHYTIRYQVGQKVQSFAGCRFQAIRHWGSDDVEDPRVSYVWAYREGSTPDQEMFIENKIVEIIPEDDV